MKDEEMAEKKYCKGCKLRMEQCLWAWRHTNGLNEPNEKNCSCKEVPAFLAGLKAGRPQWHKVADGDLPKIENRIVLCVCIGGYINNEPNYVYKLLTSREFCLFQPVIAWCEIPTFDKE